jgi:hypothetical protein
LEGGIKMPKSVITGLILWGLCTGCGLYIFGKIENKIFSKMKNSSIRFFVSLAIIFIVLLMISFALSGMGVVVIAIGKLMVFLSDAMFSPIDHFFLNKPV